MKYITFTINGMPKHVFLNNIGFVEAAPGHPDKTRVYVQGVPLLVSGTPDVVLADIQAAARSAQDGCEPPLTPLRGQDDFEEMQELANAKPVKPRRAKKGSDNVGS